MVTRSKSHRDHPPPPPAPDVTDSPASAHDPWSHDYGPREDARPPVPSGRAFRETTARRRGGPSFRERMEQAGFDPDLAERYSKRRDDR